MTTLPIPKTIDAITSEWLTAVLSDSGATGSAKVAYFETEAIAAGVGFLGKLARLSLRYDGTADDAPRTVVVKVPTLDPGGRGLAALFRFYEREIRFYQEIAGRVAVRVPRAYYSAFDGASGDFVLLLEDMAPAHLGDPLAGCSFEEAQSAVRAIAALHATWWQKPELGALTWMPNLNDPVHHSAEPAYQQCWPGFLGFQSEKLPAGLRTIGERLSSKVVRLLDALMNRPRTFVHGDYRADNLFFAKTKDSTQVAVVDWQVVFRGCAVFDIAYLLSGDLIPDVRRATEMQLLQLYWDTLCKGGVRDYTFEECLRDYRLSLLLCLVYVVITIGTLDPANERGVKLFYLRRERVAAAILDLEAAKMIPD